MIKTIMTFSASRLAYAMQSTCVSDIFVNFTPWAAALHSG